MLALSDKVRRQRAEETTRLNRVKTTARRREYILRHQDNRRSVRYRTVVR